MTALVDTGADFSVLSRALAAALRKVLAPWQGTHVRTAGGHVVAPLGACTARIEIRGITSTGSFAVVAQCSKDLILGLDFLREHGAIIDLRELMATFSTECATADESEPGSLVFRVCDDHVTLPPRARLFITVECTNPLARHGIAEGNLSLLLSQQVCVARGVLDLYNKRTQLLVTNISAEYRDLAKHTAMAYSDEDSEPVVYNALSLFAETDRADWYDSYG